MEGLLGSSSSVWQVTAPYRSTVCASRSETGLCPRAGVALSLSSAVLRPQGALRKPLQGYCSGRPGQVQVFLFRARLAATEPPPCWHVKGPAG